MNQYRTFTAREDRAIRAGWPDCAAIARRLGRCHGSVKGRALRLGLEPPGHRYAFYTERERQMVADRYATEGAIPLAAELGRPRSCIVALADRLGVCCLRRWTADDDAKIRQLRAANHSNRQIAKVMGRTTSAINKRFEFLGLTIRLYDPAAHRRKLITPRRIERMTKNNWIECRWARHRLSLGEHGWPPDLNGKEVAILNSLLKHGPQTRIHLSLSIGEPKSRHRHDRLMTHGKVSLFGRIMARGLVTRCLISASRRQRTCIYVLTAHALRARGTFQSVREFNLRILGLRAQQRKAS